MAACAATAAVLSLADLVLTVAILWALGRLVLGRGDGGVRLRWLFVGLLVVLVCQEGLACRPVGAGKSVGAPVGVFAPRGVMT